MIKQYLANFGLHLLLIFFILGSGTLHAQNKLKLVTGNNYAPFTDQGLPNRGIATKIVETVFSHSNVPVEVTFLPWERGLRETIANKYRGIFPYIKRQVWEENFIYSDPFFSMELRIVVKKDNPKIIESFSDLKGQILCLPLGYEPDERFAEMIKQKALLVYQPSELNNCIKMLLGGRVDFMTMPDYIMNYSCVKLLEDDPEKFIKYVGPSMGNIELHFLAPKSNPASKTLIAEFNRSLEALKLNGFLDPIIENYPAF
ncbi:MAG: transporter substrate-binding domain-containing protein [Halopseudomonas aestusnigri]